MSFSVEESNVNGNLRYHVKGKIDEQAKFPALAQVAVVRIDIGDVTRLNSVGTRIWCNWVALVKPPSVIIVERCPVLFIKTFGNVLGALTPSMHVVSFYVPFVAPSNGTRTDILVTREQVSDQGTLLIDPIKSPQGEVLEMDVLSNYFEFLKK